MFDLGAAGENVVGEGAVFEAGGVCSDVEECSHYRGAGAEGRRIKRTSKNGDLGDKILMEKNYDRRT